VFVPFWTEQWISARSPCFTFAFTAADIADGMAQVSWATVIEVA